MLRNEARIGYGCFLSCDLPKSRHATDGGYKYAKRRELNKFDLFPVLNLKYELKNNSIFRFSASRTITRPSFIEMAPFLYQESYGASQIRGNEILNNAYNYNFDL